MKIHKTMILVILQTITKYFAPYMYVFHLYSVWMAHTLIFILANIGKLAKATRLVAKAIRLIYALFSL